MSRRGGCGCVRGGERDGVEVWTDLGECGDGGGSGTGDRRGGLETRHLWRRRRSRNSDLVGVSEFVGDVGFWVGKV